VDVPRRPLVGRADELIAVLEVIRGATVGRPSALLISGEAGVGKTALAQEACAREHGVVDVLWASCLPLTSLAVPFLPLISALRRRVKEHAEPVQLLQSSGEARDWPVEFDSWLDRTSRQQPLVLVIDDLHWADQSTLDVLMYVLAGLAERHLAVLATFRPADVAEAHPLRRWLADVRRLPGVSELRLDRLDRAATAEQLAGLLAGPPHESLVDQVYARTDGNAYLTTLLARGLTPDVGSLPAGLPTELREAASRAWQSVSKPAREITRLIAVTGRAQHADDLGKLAAQLALSGDVVSLLREAVDAAVLKVGADATYWFVHPLLAEVLEEGLLPDERRSLHEVLAAELAQSVELSDAPRVEDVVAVADHHFLAGHRDEAYRWALLGADATGRAGGAAETVRLLRRTVQLWPGLSDPRLSRLELLRRIREAAEVSGDQEEELAAVEDLLASVDRNRDPLVAAELLVRRTRLRQVTGREFAGLDDVREAVRLSAGHPDSAEHALAMAHLAHVELWRDLPPGPTTAAEAVRVARASGSKKALAHALTAQVMAWRFAADDEIVPEGVALAQEAQAAAAESRDFWAYTHATHWAANCIDRDSSPAVLDLLRRGREEMTALGGPHTYISVLAADEASGLLFRGDWRGCVERLRIVLGSTPGAMAATLARLTAAMLAGWQGRPAEAQAHLARADELFLEHSGFLPLEFDAARAEVALATGDTQAAITAAMAGVGGPRMHSERLLPLAARALSDQIQASRDRGHDVTAALERLSDLRRRFPDIIAEPGPGRLQRLYERAMQALYDAEVLRGQADPAAAAAWCDAAKACADAEIAWDEACARRRAAEALLKDRSARAQGAAQLRRAHELAVDLEAAPLLAEVEALARTTRVSLTVPHAVPANTVTTLPDLTSREREILAYLVAGRTYAEIARELVISEKTVSVHVSNMLHKTGASNRVELAGLARRLTPRP